jgi:hypothetical protein
MCALGAVICRFLIAEYRVLEEAATAQSWRRYVRSEVIRRAADTRQIDEA